MKFTVKITAAQAKHAQGIGHMTLCTKETCKFGMHPQAKVEMIDRKWFLVAEIPA